MVFVIKNELQPQGAGISAIIIGTVWVFFTNQNFYHAKSPLKQHVTLNKRACIS